jgi:tripartite-type tricarboxylate transporter receptor subunit TctC
VPVPPEGVKERFARIGQVPLGGSAETTAGMIRSESDRWAALIKAHNMDGNCDRAAHRLRSWAQ